MLVSETLFQQLVHEMEQFIQIERLPENVKREALYFLRGQTCTHEKSWYLFQSLGLAQTAVEFQSIHPSGKLVVEDEQVRPQRFDRFQGRLCIVDEQRLVWSLVLEGLYQEGTDISIIFHNEKRLYVFLRTEVRLLVHDCSPLSQQHVYKKGTRDVERERVVEALGSAGEDDDSLVVTEESVDEGFVAQHGQ